VIARAETQECLEANQGWIPGTMHKDKRRDQPRINRARLFSLT
jgi:hypothetical protein